MIPKEKIEELEATHKRIAVVRGNGDPPAWEIVMRKPTRAEYKMFRAQLTNPAQAPDAQEILVRKCVVYPDAAAFDAMLEDYPAIPEAVGDALRRLIGLGAAEDTK